jgi:Holliday junction resolvase RusA-like endonuclease
MIEFFVPGKPEALKRHRTYRFGSKNINVDPSSAAKDSFLVRACSHRPKEPIREALAVVMEFRFPRPKSHYTSKGIRSTAPLYHTSRPDADNLAKFVADALNGIFWHDDSCIAQLIVEKKYGATPGVFLRIMPAEIECFGFKNIDQV